MFNVIGLTGSVIAVCSGIILYICSPSFMREMQKKFIAISIILGGVILAGLHISKLVG